MEFFLGFITGFIIINVIVAEIDMRRVRHKMKDAHRELEFLLKRFREIAKKAEKEGHCIGFLDLDGTPACDWMCSAEDKCENKSKPETKKSAEKPTKKKTAKKTTKKKAPAKKGKK